MPTVVSRWFTVWPMPVPAHSRSDAAVRSWSGSLALPTSGSASTTLPVFAVMLTLPATSSMSPTVTLPLAHSRAVASPPLLKIRLDTSCVIEPPLACTSIPPRVGAVLEVRMSACAFNTTLRDAITLTLPLPLTMSALAVMSLVVSPAPTPAWISTLPVPLALTAMSSVGVVAVPGAVPLFSVMPPAVVRSTMLPSPPVVRTSLCTASLTVEPVTTPLLSTRLTVTVTSSTTSPLASST